MRTHPALLRRLETSNAFLQRLKLSISFLYMLILLPFYFSGRYSSNPSGYFVKGQTRAIVAIYNLVSEFTNSLQFVTIVVPDTVFCAVALALVYFIRMLTVNTASIWNLETCETKLGFVTILCTGKKSVFTLNDMVVQSTWIAGDLHKEIGAQSWINTMPKDIQELLSEGVALNTTGNDLYRGTNSETLENSCESPMEKALLRWGCSVGMNFDSTRKKCTTLKMEFFESERMRSGVAIRRESDGKCIVHWKGAAEIILSSCSRVVCIVGGKATTQNLSEEARSNIEKEVKIMGESGLSCVALAYREGALGDVIAGGEGGIAGTNLPKEGSRLRNSTCLQEMELTLLAVVGMKETCRKEAKEYVKKAKDAGIRVIMVTGDSLLAASAIAKECGIIEDNEDSKVVDASMFQKWDESEMPEKLEKLAVLARASASHKLQLVKNLQAYNKKEVVALTGHKVTEAPALEQADVAFSLSCGVEVAKESSDIVLLNDSFASIYKAIELARCMRYNIQHFLHFQVTLSFATALISGLTTMQFQWINLMNLLAAIALTMQPPLCSLMSKSPIPPVDGPLFTYPMWRNVALQAAYQVILLGRMSYFESTIIFNTFIFCQLINVVNARQSLLQEKLILHTGPLKSFVKRERLLLAVIAVIAIVQVLLIMFVGSLLSTQRLNWAHWLLCLGLALPSWVIAALGKCLPMPDTPTSGLFST